MMVLAQQKIQRRGVGADSGHAFGFTNNASAALDVFFAGLVVVVVVSSSRSLKAPREMADAVSSTDAGAAGGRGGSMLAQKSKEDLIAALTKALKQNKKLQAKVAELTKEKGEQDQNQVGRRRKCLNMYVRMCRFRCACLDASRMRKWRYRKSWKP